MSEQSTLAQHQIKQAAKKQKKGSVKQRILVPKASGGSGPMNFDFAKRKGHYKLPQSVKGIINYLFGQLITFGLRQLPTSAYVCHRAQQTDPTPDLT